MFRVLSIALGLYCLVAAAIAGWVYFDALESGLASDRRAGQVRLSEAASRLRGQMDVYRVLVNIVADNPKIARSMDGAWGLDMNLDLSLLQLKYGAWRIDLVDLNNTLVASSNFTSRKPPISKKLIRTALDGSLGFTVELYEGERLVQFSRRVLGQGSKALGVVVVSANLANLEFEWPITPEPIVFFDSAGLSVSGNRSGLLMRSNAADPEEAAFPLEEKTTLSGTKVADYRTTEGKVTEVQTLSLQIPQLQMTGQILLETNTARAVALLRTWLALALLVALALVAAVFVQQRRRLALESRHSTTLEQRVEERTEELKETQNELVEASNLAALGRLSAGVSHELNQPLGAILNFAENGKRLLQKSRVADASKNLTEIADQVRRITRIIGNLRAFAKQEHTPTESVDFCGVVYRAVDLMQTDIRVASVEQQISVPKHPVLVTAGKLRLEQVVLNLVSNAIDAMQTRDEKLLTVLVEHDDKNVSLIVRDTGGGIEDPARVFEPFYTTKELGASKGLGMGLALSFGLISHFGGQLTCRNLEKGAEFRVDLPKIEGAE